MAEWLDVGQVVAAWPQWTKSIEMIHVSGWYLSPFCLAVAAVGFKAKDGVAEFSPPGVIPPGA